MHACMYEYTFSKHISGGLSSVVMSSEDLGGYERGSLN